MRYTKLISLAFVSGSLFLSCAEGKKTTSKKQNSIMMSQTDTIQLSPVARLFRMDLNKELSSSPTPVNEFKPSQKLMDKYGILLFNNKYWAQGIITTHSSFDTSQMHVLGIAMASFLSTGKANVQIPLQSFNEFLQLKGISYFEMSYKSQLNNK